MFAIAVGIHSDDNEPLPLIDQKDLEDTWPGKDLKWDGERVCISLIVELPFWLILPDCEISLTHDRASLVASIRGNYYLGK